MQSRSSLRASVILMILSSTASVALGHTLGSAWQGRAKPPEAIMAPAVAAGSPARPRKGVVKLKVLDVVVDVAEVPTWSSADVAELGAKKWKEMLTTAASIHARGMPSPIDLGEYFQGWEAMVGITQRYSPDQFASSLAAQVCGERPEIRELLQKNASSASAAAGCVP